MASEREKRIEKVKKLLRMASSPEEHEAKMALKLAQEIANDAGIDIDSLSEDEVKILTENVSPGTKTMDWWVKELASTLAEFFPIKMYFQSERSLFESWSQFVHVIGRKVDCDLYKELFLFYVKAAKQMHRTFLRQYKHNYQVNNGRKLRKDKVRGVSNTYYGCFIRGMKEFFEKNATENALVVYVPKEAEEIYSEIEFSPSRERNIKLANDSDAYWGGKNDGYAAGSLKNQAIGERI